MIEIRCISDDPLMDVSRANGVSRGVLSIEAPSLDPDKWLRFFIAGHSTAEWIPIVVEDATMRGDVASHIVRHTKGHPRFVVQSKRPDWNKGQARPSSDSSRLFSMLVTPISLKYMAHQRLCTRAMKETRDWMMALKQAMWGWRRSYTSYNYGDDDTEGSARKIVIHMTSLTMVPECVAQCGCPYGKKTCGHFDTFLSMFGDDFDKIDIRYKNYQTFLEGKCK